MFRQCLIGSLTTCSFILTFVTLICLNDSTLALANGPSNCTRVVKPYQVEVFAFRNGGGIVHPQWRRLTAVAWHMFDDMDILQRAHDSGVRAIMDGRNGINTSMLCCAPCRARWVAAKVREAGAICADGINFDLEDPISVTSKNRKCYTKLVRETAAAFHSKLPGSQVSVDVPWSAYDVDGRNYDWRGLAAAADILFVMAYDMQSQIWGPCIAGANSPLRMVERGLRQYLDMNIPASKLILGLPWYGYDYECVNATSNDTRACFIAPVPFRGAPCSDAAGRQVSFANLMALLRSKQDSTTLQWDDVQQSPFFNYVSDDGSIHQVWFDTPQSLKLKYGLAKSLQLRGVGIFAIDYLDTDTGDPQIAADNDAMWQALDAFHPPQAQHDVTTDVEYVMESMASS